MIANISDKMIGFVGILHYHEVKVDNDKAELIYNCLSGSSTYKDYVNDFNLVASLNDRAKTRCYDISLNLPHGEDLSNEKFIYFAQAYLNKMDLNNTPYLIHRHNDKEHNHIHITLSRIDYDGKVVNDNDIKFRSEIASRELEREWNLKPVLNLNYDLKLLSELNQRQYNFQNAFRKGLNNKAAITSIKELIDKDTIAFIKKNHLTNTQMTDLLNEKTKPLVELLLKHSHFQTLFKDELLLKIDSLYAISKNKGEFFQYCEKEGISVFQKSNKGVSQYTYTMNDLNITFKEDRLPKKYCFKSLGAFYDPREYVLKSEQKHNLYNSIHLSLSGATSIDNFEKRMLSNNIRFTKQQGDSGKEYYFSLSNCENSEYFKASVINKKFSLNNFIKHFNELEISNLNLNSDIINSMAIEQELIDNTVSLPLFNTPSRTQKGEDFMTAKKKKKGKVRLRDREI